MPGPGGAGKIKHDIEVFFQPLQLVFSCPQQGFLTTGFLLLPRHLLEPRCKTGRSSWLLKMELTLNKFSVSGQILAPAFQIGSAWSFSSRALAPEE